jgi:hypothetical protein
MEAGAKIPIKSFILAGGEGFKAGTQAFGVKPNIPSLLQDK